MPDRDRTATAVRQSDIHGRIPVFDRRIGGRLSAGLEDRDSTA